MIRVGAFWYEQGILMGPDEYMASESYNRTMRSIEENRGRVLVDLMASARNPKEKVEAALQVFQMDYVRWLARERGKRCG